MRVEHNSRFVLLAMSIDELGNIVDDFVGLKLSQIWFTSLRMPVISASNCTEPTNEKIAMSKEPQLTDYQKELLKDSVEW